MESTTTLPAKLVSASGGLVEGEFLRSSRREDPYQGCRLVLKSGGEEFAAVAFDYFSALAAIRSALEPRGLIPRCYGASRNVYPSGMLLDWGGLFAYRTYLGRRGAREDLVGIFDDGPDVDPVSVQVQEDFHQEWLRSLDPPRKAAAPAAARPPRRFWWLPSLTNRKS